MSFLYFREEREPKPAKNAYYICNNGGKKRRTGFFSLISMSLISNWLQERVREWGEPASQPAFHDQL